jgi:uncharacterized protein (DUF1015 family)
MTQNDPQALRIHPFRGLRFDPGRVRDPAAVTSPPYDMIGPEEAQRLADTEEHNVVRLILPSPDETDPSTRYRRAASSLTEWISDGALALDPEPAFYVYEQSGAPGRQRGLIALVKLDDKEHARAILPHEAVVETVVDDRLAQMLATSAHVEPILLTYSGDHTVSDALDEVADSTPPVSQTTTRDGVCHRLWAVTDPDVMGRISAALLWHRALIADGHHRHAAYLKLRDKLGTPASDYGLALLVDSSRYPLSLHAIHRVLPSVPLAEAVEAASAVFTATQIPADGDELSALDDVPAHKHAFVLSDGSSSWLLTDPDHEALEAAIPTDRPQKWRRLDATVLHYLLVETIWKLPDTPEEVRFDHDPDHAVDHAASAKGTAVLLRPTTEAAVRELAAAGVLMPRKSTAFGPKPATGLVMRLLEER